MKIKAILYRILHYFIFKPPIFLYKIIIYLIYLIYTKIYYNFIIIYKLLISLIIYFVNNNDLVFNIIFFIKEEFFLFTERLYRFFTLKRWAWIDFVIWTHYYYYYWRNQDMDLFDSYNKFYSFYLIVYKRYIYYKFFILSKYACLKNSFLPYHGWDDVIDLYDLDIYYHEYYISLFLYNKYIYRYPLENMYIYYYYFFVVKPGNFLLLRHYADKDLPLFGAKLFVNYKCPVSGDIFSCFVCPLFAKTTKLHMLSGIGTKYYDTYNTSFIVLPDKFLKNPKSEFNHPIPDDL